MPYLKEEIREKILASAIAQFKENGYGGASMRQIAQNAGVSLGNVYRYFESKEDLFNAIVGPIHKGFMSFMHGIDELVKTDVKSEKTTGTVYSSNIDEIYEIKDKIFEICAEHYTELLILMDRSTGTKYETTKQLLTNLLDKILKSQFVTSLGDNNKDLSGIDTTYILSASFIESICIILRNYEEGNKILILIDKFINLFFDDLENRITL